MKETLYVGLYKRGVKSMFENFVERVLLLL